MQKLAQGLTNIRVCVCVIQAMLKCEQIIFAWFNVCREDLQCEDTYIYTHLHTDTLDLLVAKYMGFVCVCVCKCLVYLYGSMPPPSG